MQVRDTDEIRRILSTPHSALAQELIKIVADSGALLEGHFQLQSGKHAPYFIRFGQFGWHREALVRIARQLVNNASFETQCKKTHATVVCPESAGIYLGKAIANETGSPLAVVAIDSHRRPTSELRLGKVDPERPILVVNDIVTTGASLSRLFDLAGPAGISGVLTFGVWSPVSFRKRMAESKIPAEWLVAALWEVYEPSACPLCREHKRLLSAQEFN